jgi:hypothetical protein
MTANDFTLNDFFSIAEIPRNRLTDLESQDSIISLKTDLLSRFKGLNWKAVWAMVTDHFEQVMDVRLLDIMVRGWNKYRELLEYRDRTKFPPDESYLVTLAEHTITSKHQPAIEIRIDGVIEKRIPFEILFTLKASGIILHIRDGRIQKIHTGSCKGSGTLKCMGFLLLEKQSSDITLPGTIVLSEGIPIGSGSGE